MLQAIGIVMLGAAVGGALRFLVTHQFSEVTFHHGFPYGTLAVNVLGSFIVGYVLTWSADHSHDRWRLLMATGFCGGFTTFSTFAFETMSYWHDSQFALVALNISLNNVGSFLALLAGIRLHPGSR